MHTFLGGCHATAKVFTNGHNQAIRLPKAFRVDVVEKWIARNEMTREIMHKPKDTEKLRKRRLDALMTAIAQNPLPDDFYKMHAKRHLELGKQVDD